MTRDSSCVAGHFAAGPLAAMAGLARAATDVPGGGAVLSPGAGSGQIVIEVKNRTGKDAYDVSVSVFGDDGGAVPNITGEDIVQNDSGAESDDVVDDNGDGMAGAGEDDTDSSPGTTCKSILKTGDAVKSDKIAEVTVDFNGPLPEGAKIRVKFPERIGNKHYDLCMVPPIDDGGFVVALVQTGPAQMGSEVLNLSSQTLDHLSIPTHAGPVLIVDARLDSPFDNRVVIIDDDSVEIYDLVRPRAGRRKSVSPSTSRSNGRGRSSRSRCSASSASSASSTAARRTSPATAPWTQGTSWHSSTSGTSVTPGPISTVMVGSSHEMFSPT